MAQFDNQILTAKRLITKFGEVSTHRRATDGAPADPTQEWNPTTPTNADTAVTAVWLDYELKRIDNLLIKRGDQEVLIAGSDLATPPDAETDVLIRADGAQWAIISVETLSPNGQLILYTIQARQ
jgi:hypothetical protein